MVERTEINDNVLLQCPDCGKINNVAEWNYCTTDNNDEKEYLITDVLNNDDELECFCPYCEDNFTINRDTIEDMIYEEEEVW